MPGFDSFSGFLHPFVLGNLATSAKVNVHLLSFYVADCH